MTRVSLNWMAGARGKVTAPRGFLAAGVYSGIKRAHREDVSLIYSEAPCRAAGVFTKNQLTAWPVEWSKKAVQTPFHHAIYATSGNANCFNGPTGEKAVKLISEKLSHKLGIPKASLLLAQTGVIGVPFPLKTIGRGVETAVKKLGKHSRGAARGILTTDKCTKELALSFSIRGRKIYLASIAKGSGMIHPNLATMLVFVTTDLNIEKRLLQKLVKQVSQETFNRMSIDNDLSTNDTVFVLANGLAGNPRLKTEKEAKPFYEALLALCRKQRLEIVEDGEGVTKVCRIHIDGAKTDKEADKAARQIANSMLFKTMLAGSDPNWGRVAAALGSTGVPLKWNKIVISFDQIPILKNGKPQTHLIARAKAVVKKRHFDLKVDLKRGSKSVDFVTSDLTKEYVRINGEYTT